MRVHRLLALMVKLIGVLLMENISANLYIILQLIVAVIRHQQYLIVGGLLQLIIGSVLMISLGIIGHYISRIYDEIKRRPKYIISKKCGN